MNEKEKQGNENELELEAVEQDKKGNVYAKNASEAPETELADSDIDNELEGDEEEERDKRRAAAATSSAPAAKSGGGKAWMYISIGLALVLLVVLISPFGGGKNETVGSVNGVSISKDQLYDEMVKLGGQQTLDNLIQDELIKQEADKAGIKITDADVDKEIDNIKKQFPTEDDFQAALMQANMTVEDLKKQTPMQLRIKKLLEPQTKVTDEDVKKFFEENKAQFDQPEQVRASHILVATKEEADAILKQLKEGADFAQLAKEKSTDPGSKDQGGDLGFFGKGDMDPAFEAAAFKLKKDELSEPIKTDYGYHIIKGAEHKEAKAATLDEKKAEIKEQLISQKVQELSQAWLEDLKSKANITNTLTADDATNAEVPAANAGTNGQ
ncbi:foldase protein PrsA [Paenibacillus montanisoli]|uniref:Foldase protein PrsA n=1 Tax=Paenibacillus montanisoli TaxID=2081970 RepID=A0A328U2L6_9BACL|nr:peptidylprolyl isomerase [Paenibacillus montanisoli]RAP76312.1 peptidylprolyl isomerase [Paenibacillus montanisoli]